MAGPMNMQTMTLHPQRLLVLVAFVAAVIFTIVSIASPAQSSLVEVDAAEKANLLTPTEEQAAAESEMPMQEVIQEIRVERDKSVTQTVDEGKCLNPYSQKGFIWFPNDKEETDTTYVPFYPGMLEQPFASIWNEDGTPTDPTINGDRYYPDDRPPYDLMATAPHRWMQDFRRHYILLQKSRGNTVSDDDDSDAALANPRKPIYTKLEEAELQALEERLSWIRNTRVLIVSDSVDRYQATFMCDRFGEALVTGPTGHQTASWCHVPYWNFTVTNWHISSTSTTRPDWWWLKNMAVVPFERRWKEFYQGSVRDVIGMNGKSPDLLIFQTGIWDHKMFVTGRRAKDNAVDFNYQRSLNWREMRFYMQRVRKIIGMMRSTFGDDVPLLFRVTTLRQGDFENVGIHNIIRAARFVSRELNIEVMEFGSLVQGYFQFYIDQLHVGKGPLSVLWSNMMFWYLFRTQGGIEVKGELMKLPEPQEQKNVVQNWKLCHDVFMNDPK
ncbi:hypothetical protein V1512DRAFT_263183 [Lipomyces arxii]|uniref:uncharacterized protein n=1 Tax=Lipomyces arxii TaxID=56418 RepID=UPI0034CDD758